MKIAFLWPKPSSLPSLWPNLPPSPPPRTSPCLGRFHTFRLFMLDNPNPNCYETLHRTMTKVVISARIDIYRVRSKTHLAHVDPQIHGPSAIPPEFIKGLNFYLLELYQYRKKIHVITNVYESDKLLGVYGCGVLKRNQPLAYFDLEANDGTAVDARWRNSLAVMPDVIGFRNARCVQAALDTGMAGNVMIKPWQLFANPKLLWSLDEFKETAHTSAGADSYWMLVEAEDKEDALDAAPSTAMRVMVNTMAHNRYSNTLYTCPEGHSLEVTAMAYSLLPNSLDPKKIPVDY
ncbi:MAG: hypothetical protein BYD32DRAFT_439786 [Podila humilis]|nr:MAG: hypothetical protein BYD32DRAFT_439786 [Podila humilis]